MKVSLSFFSNFSDAPVFRWLPLLCVVALFHLFAFFWVFQRAIAPLKESTTPPAFTVDLHPLQRVGSSASDHNPRLATSAPSPDAASRHENAGTTTAFSHSANDDKPTTAQPQTVGVQTPASSHPASSAATSTDRLASDFPPYLISPPPSARLKYHVQSVRSQRYESGDGTILWAIGSAQYRIHGTVNVQNSRMLAFRSAGRIDRHLLMPSAYAEQREHSPEAVTTFHRETNRVLFSDSLQTSLRQNGEQDVSSVIWQIAGVGRYDEGTFLPKAEFQIFVAGASSARIWRIQVIGREIIESPLGKILAWHLVRTAPAGSQDPSFEFWLAPEREWYPVRLRYTEANGDVLDLTVSEITLVPDT